MTDRISNSIRNEALYRASCRWVGVKLCLSVLKRMAARLWLSVSDIPEW